MFEMIQVLFNVPQSLGLKKKLYVSCNSLKKNRVGRLVIFFSFWSKMCVLCMFFVDLELGGRKKL